MEQGSEMSRVSGRQMVGRATAVVTGSLLSLSSPEALFGQFSTHFCLALDPGEQEWPFEGRHSRDERIGYT